MNQIDIAGHGGSSPAAQAAEPGHDAGHELREILISGRIDEIERIDALLERLQSDDDPLARARSDREALLGIVEGIQAVLSQDTRQGIAHLERAATVTRADDSLRWVALHWMARGAAEQGELARAERAADEALALAARLSPQAHSLSLLSLAEITSLLEQPARALDYLRQAIQTLKGVQDDRGAATALLAMARTLCRVGREDDGCEAAVNAHLADPERPEAAVFLSERALAAGEVRQAAQLVEPFADHAPAHPAVERQRWLIEGLRERRYEPLDVAELLRLRDGPLDAEAVEEMRSLALARPGFHQLQELLAWSLYKLGQVDEAEACFVAMSALPLDPQLRTSVALGLGCLASSKHQRPASRVKAATGSYPVVMPMIPEQGGGDGAAGEPPPRAASSRTPTQRLDPPLAQLPLASSPAAGPRRTAGMTTDAAFVGDLQLLAVPDLLDFLQSSRRTGTLVITSGVGTAAVHMIRGRITGAAAPNTASLGDMLIERNALSEGGLVRALRHKQEIAAQHLLGAVLLAQGQVDRQTLETALVDQVKMALLEAVSWSEGRFAFEPTREDAPAHPDEIVVDLDTRAVLMDVLREFDERNR